VAVCLELGADLHMAQLMPLTVSCFSKIKTGFTFLVLAHLGHAGKRAVKRVCVCVCVLSLLIQIQTDRHTDKCVHHNTTLPTGDKVININRPLVLVLKANAKKPHTCYQEMNNYLPKLARN